MNVVRQQPKSLVDTGLGFAAHHDAFAVDEIISGRKYLNAATIGPERGIQAAISVDVPPELHDAFLEVVDL